MKVLHNEALQIGGKVPSGRALTDQRHKQVTLPDVALLLDNEVNDFPPLNRALGQVVC